MDARAKGLRTAQKHAGYPTPRLRPETQTWTSRLTVMQKWIADSDSLLQEHPELMSLSGPKAMLKQQLVGIFFGSFGPLFYILLGSWGRTN